MLCSFGGKDIFLGLSKFPFNHGPVDRELGKPKCLPEALISRLFVVSTL